MSETKTPTEISRSAFEEWIAAPPFEESVLRYSDDEMVAAFPGQYRSRSVQLAWEAWGESRDNLTSELAAERQKVAELRASPHYLQPLVQHRWLAPSSSPRFTAVTASALSHLKHFEKLECSMPFSTAQKNEDETKETTRP